MTTFKHPFLIFSFGVIVGYHLHKYRKDLIEAMARGSDPGASSGVLSDILSGLKQGASDAKRA